MGGDRVLQPRRLARPARQHRAGPAAHPARSRWPRRASRSPASSSSGSPPTCCSARSPRPSPTSSTAARPSSPASSPPPSSTRRSRIGYNLVWLYVAQFVIEAAGLFTQPAKQVIWVAIVPKKLLATANQISLMSVYGTVPVASGVFALLSAVDRLITGKHAAVAQPRQRRHRHRAAAEHGDVPGQRDDGVPQPAPDPRRAQPARAGAGHRQPDPRGRRVRAPQRADPRAVRRHHRRVRGRRPHRRRRPAVGRDAVGRRRRLLDHVRDGVHRPRARHAARAAHPADLHPQPGVRAGHRQRRRRAADHVGDPQLHPGRRAGRARRRVGRRRLDHRLHADRARGRGPAARTHLRLRPVLGAHHAAADDRGRAGAGRPARLARVQGRRALLPALLRAGPDAAGRRRAGPRRELVRDHAHDPLAGPRARPRPPPGDAHRLRPARPTDRLGLFVTVDGVDPVATAGYAALVGAAVRERGASSSPRRPSRPTRRSGAGSPSCCAPTRASTPAPSTASSRRPPRCCRPPTAPSTSRP